MTTGRINQVTIILFAAARREADGQSVCVTEREAISQASDASSPQGRGVHLKSKSRPSRNPSRRRLGATADIPAARNQKRLPRHRKLAPARRPRPAPGVKPSSVRSIVTRDVFSTWNKKSLVKR